MPGTRKTATKKVIVNATWNGQAQIDLFKQIYGEEVTTLLGLEKIPSDSIYLTPALLK